MDLDREQQQMLEVAAAAGGRFSFRGMQVAEMVQAAIRTASRT